MKVAFRITRGLLQTVRTDLNREHPFSAERVGFIGCKPAMLPNNGILIVAHQYLPVADEDYLEQTGMGAMMGTAAIRKALQASYHQDLSMFHVHMHEHKGFPTFSPVDNQESAKFVPDFWNVKPGLPHGALVLSHDQLNGKCWIPGIREVREFTDLSEIGSPLLRIWRN